MKKLIYLIIISLLPIFASSQVKFGLQGGITLSRTEMTNDFSSLKLGYKPGPLFGAMVGINLGESSFSVMQELNYVSKGAQVSGTDLYGGNTVTVEGTQTTNYIELPLNILYYVPLGAGHVFIGTGPYGAVGLKGKNKLTYHLYRITEVEETNIAFGSQTEQLKPLDYGIHGLIGYKLRYGSYLKAYYSHGLSDLSNNSAYTYKNRYFGVSFGYFFGSGRK
jgi:hypothetical protein